MIEQVGPCTANPPAVAVFNAVLNATTLVLIAWLTRRAVAKDTKERKANGHRTDAQ